jgi:RNA polymerase sigma-70 factor (ECF subfamily)
MTRVGSTANSLVPLALTAREAAETCSAANANCPRILVLTRGLAAGDEEAFRQFHAEYFDRLFQFLLVVARGQQEEAEEALQQTLLRVLRYARPFSSEETFWCWLKALARSAAQDAGRKQQRYLALLKRFALGGRDARTTADEEHILPGILKESLAELPLEDRQLLEEKYFERATVRELAQAAAQTEKAVESRLVRLRRHLREQMIKKLNSK